MDVGKLLTDIETERERAVQRLGRHLSQLEALHSSRRLLVRHIEAILREEDHAMLLISARSVPAQRVMSIQRRLRADETDTFVDEAKGSFARHLGGAQLTGPFTLIFHGIVDDESDGPLEAILGCQSDIGPSDVIGIRTEPAHDEAFTTITKAEWEYQRSWAPTTPWPAPRR